MKAMNALGLQFNAKKSVVLVQGKKAHFQEWRRKGEAVKRVKEAKYLRLWVEESREWTTHTKERITKTKQALYSLRQREAYCSRPWYTHFPDGCRGYCQVYLVIWTMNDKAFQIMVIEAVWNETARSVLQVYQRTVAGVCRAELGWLTIKAVSWKDKQ